MISFEMIQKLLDMDSKLCPVCGAELIFNVYSNEYFCMSCGYFESIDFEDVNRYDKTR